MLRFVVALLLAVACSADIGTYSEEIFNECTVCNLQNALVNHPEYQAFFPQIPLIGPMDCQDVCMNQAKACHALKLAVSEFAAAPEETKLMAEFSEILAVFVDPNTMCGAVSKSKYGQKLFLGLDEKLGCKVCGMGSTFLCKTLFKGETAEKINAAIGKGANKLCVAMKIPVFIQKIKIFGELDVCGKVKTLAESILPKFVAPWFCEKEKAQVVCGKMFKDCTL